MVSLEALTTLLLEVPQYGVFISLDLLSWNYNSVTLFLHYF